VYTGHADVCELLLDAGADVDATDSAGRTTLQASPILQSVNQNFSIQLTDCNRVHCIKSM